MTEQVLQTEVSRVVIDVDHGARIASLTVADHDLLLSDQRDDPITWGLYPMAPWVGRLRDGHIPGHPPVRPNLGPHALHGTAFLHPWVVKAPGVLELELGPPWPFRGRLTQHVRLTESDLTLRLALEADEPQPVCLGYHPWFPRHLAERPVSIDMAATAMLATDDRAIPTGELVPIPEGPFDDAFVGVTQPVGVCWGDLLRLELSAPEATHWVRFDRLPDRVCIEPQTGPPDAPNSAAPPTLEAGETTSLTFRLRWLLLG